MPLPTPCRRCGTPTRKRPAYCKPDCQPAGRRGNRGRHRPWYNDPHYQATRAYHRATSGACYWCHTPLPPGTSHTDHDPPIAQTGWPAWNGQLRRSCAPCNLKRGGTPGGGPNTGN